MLKNLLLIVYIPFGIITFLLSVLLACIVILWIKDIFKKRMMIFIIN